MNDFGAVSVAEKEFLSDRLSVPLPVINGMLVVPLYLLDGFHRHAVSKTVGDSGIDWASLAKGAGVQLWTGKDAASARNKDVISISQVFNEASCAGKPLSLSDCMITATGCCRLSVQDRALPSARDTVAAKLVREIQQHKLLGNIEGCQVSRIATVSIRLASCENCYEAFFCVC